MSQSLRDLIKQGLTEATKAQDKRRMATLRLIQAALKDRDIAGRTDGRDAGVSDAEILVIAETGAASIKDMGRVMGELKKRHSGQMDFAKAGAIVKEKLA